jgi:hypothetical protein
MGARVGSRCVGLAAAVALVVAATVPASAAGAFLYWANEGGNAIGRANLDGSAPNQGFVGGAAGPCGVAVDGSHLYWASEDTDMVGRANLDGSAVNPWFIASSGAFCGVAVDGAHVYWSAVSPTLFDTIGRANLDGSGADEGFIGGAASPCGVALDGAHVLWANEDSGKIGRANLDGSGVGQGFIGGADLPCGVAVAGSRILWANGGGNSIGRANLDGSGVDQSFITGADDPCGVAVDGAHVFWANFGKDSIGRANLDGSGVDQSFITGADEPCGVAVDVDRRTLTVSTGGSGSGSVSGPGIDCPGDCTESYATGAAVTLKASPADRSVFTGWAGACSGTGACTVTMGADATVAASFTRGRTLTVSSTGPGSGRISAPGLDCRACSQAYLDGTQISLEADPDGDSRFTGWDAACSGDGPCSLTMNDDRSASAGFGLRRPETKIIGARVRASRRRARFEFTRSGRASGFGCRLKRRHHRARGFRRCRSPRTYRHLKPGRYSFEVRAVGPSGPDRTPARRRFRISG